MARARIWSQRSRLHEERFERAIRRHSTPAIGALPLAQVRNSHINGWVRDRIQHQLAMGHTTPTVTLNTYVGYWSDAVDQTPSLVDSALGCTRDVPGAPSQGKPAGQSA